MPASIFENQQDLLDEERMSRTRAIQGVYCRRKKPALFVMKMNCEFVAFGALNNSPVQSIHVPFMAGVN